MTRRGFSLIEMMIAIVILGLGLVMVATMFPIAWSRARDLSEHTTGRSIAAGAHALVESLVRPSALASDNLTLVSAGFAGDLLPVFGLCGSLHPASLPADTRVHALNLENVLADEPDDFLIAEDPWQVELVPDLRQIQNDPNCPIPAATFDALDTRSFYTARVRLGERVYPALSPPPPTSGSDLDRWYDQVSRRRFAWSALHRLRQLPATPTLGQLVGAMNSSRALDVYVVTLRRPNPNYRYARQNSAGNFVPNPLNTAAPPVSPQAMNADADTLFPTPWRVQMQFLGTLSGRSNATGIPTEVVVPPGALSPTSLAGAMLIQMFVHDTRVVDERNGQIYRVVQRRFVGDRVTLTLDREIVVEDLDDDPNFGQDGTLQPSEALRTVWIFPPPVDRSAAGGPPIFTGNSPVVDIDVRTSILAPSSSF